MCFWQQWKVSGFSGLLALWPGIDGCISRPCIVKTAKEQPGSQLARPPSPLAFRCSSSNGNGFVSREFSDLQECPWWASLCIWQHCPFLCSSTQGWWWLLVITNSSLPHLVPFAPSGFPTLLKPMPFIKFSLFEKPVFLIRCWLIWAQDGRRWFCLPNRLHDGRKMSSALSDVILS